MAGGKEGRLVWIIPDGDLPPPGEGRLRGHESLIIINTGLRPAEVRLDFFFEDRDPDEGISVEVPARRVRCFRLDEPLGDVNYRLRPGQYGLRVASSEPVVVQFGRMDVRQPNLAYYCTMGFPA